jgi:hypothetical protein
MALFNFFCSKCGEIARLFLDTCDNEFVAPVCKCGYLMLRATKGPSTTQIERLDNGAMVTALERYTDAERIMQERHENADELAGTRPNRS